MTYVGLTITDATGHESALEQFIRDYCIFERPDIPHNIAYKAKGVNVYSDAFRGFSTAQMNTLVGGLSFSATPIGVESPRVLVVSSVNFVLEFIYKGVLIRLMPTEYLSIPSTDASLETFKILSKRGCIRIYTP